MAGTNPARPTGMLDVLIIDDVHEDAELMVLELRRAGFEVRSHRVDSAAGMSAALDREHWDVILCDYTMPDFTYQAALSLVRDRGLLAPFLLVSATVLDETAIEAMRAGARDIIMKDKLRRLGPAVARELEYLERRLQQRTMEEELARSERHFRALIEHSSDAVCLMDHEGVISYSSASSERILGYSPEELVGRNGIELVDPESKAIVRQGFAKVMAGPGQIVSLEARVQRKDGVPIWIECVSTNLLEDAAARAIVVNFRDVTERRHAQDALRASEERFVRFMQHLPGAAWIKSANGRYMYANATAERIFGRTLPELRGKKDEEIFPPATAAEFRENDHKALAGGAFQTLETLRYPDGSVHHSIVSKFPIPGPEGDPVLVGGVAIDITEQQRAEEMLRKSEQRFRALMENSSDGFALVDQQGTVCFVGPPILGYQNHEFLGRNLAGIIHPDDRDHMLGALRDLMASPGKIVISEYRVRHKNGTWRWVEGMSKNLIDDPAVKGIVVNYRDTTERRAIEEELRERAQLLDLAHDAILSLSWDGAIQFWSRGAEEMYGWKKQEAMRRISHQLLRTRFPKPFAEIEKEMLTHDRWEGELVHARRDGGEITVSSRWALRRDAGGQPSGYLEINTDITARKRFEEQLRETQKLESLGVLAGGIAHDFNNLLTGILGNATLALHDLSPSSPVRSMLQHVVHGSERAATLIRQLLAYSGRGRFVVEPVSLSELVQEIAELVRLSIPKAIQLHLHLAENLPAIEADAVQLQQLIMNLVINGAEAIGEDKVGTLSVATGTQEVDANYIQTTLAAVEIQPGMYVALEVHDTGQGMDEATIGRIFDPFFTTKFTGRGLGLAAVLGIVRGHRAAIKVYSVPGRGTTFKVLFPATAQPAQAGKTETPAANLAGSGTVLVVDDEEIVRSTAGQTLERYGYTVLTASNGQEAVNLFRDHAREISVVLLDLTMPVMSGEETLRHMQAIRGDVRVILSSGYNEVEAVERFADKALAGFLQKPYTAATLAARVKAVIERPR